MAAAHELLSLPPLETSAQKEPNPAAVQSNLSVPKDKDAARFLQSPTPSFAESFSTAFTSPDDEVEETTRLGLSSLAPPQSLRKSVSVDSFTPYNLDGSQSQSNLSPQLSQSNVYNIAPVTQRRADAHVWPGRHNESLNTLRRDHQSSSPLDSDVDRYDPISLPAIERFRNPSLKSQDPSKPPAPGGLSLPSRTQSSSAVASSSGHGPREREHLLSMSPSLQASSRRGSAFATPAEGRVRSGSLGYNPPNSSKRTITNPHIPPSVRSSTSKQDVTVVVVGTTGCGKSTVIKEGLPGWTLVESKPGSESTHSFSRYMRETGSLSVDQSPPPAGSITVLDVLEVEIQTTNSGLVKWPQGLPAFDGVLICYDSSTASSYQPVESVLKGYRSTNLPIMVLSCKADLPHEMEPNDAVEILKDYDTGLIEVSSTTDPGREKMVQSFQYLLKAISLQRGPGRVIDGRNPASPDFLLGPWSRSSNNTPTSSPTIPSPTGASSTNVHIPQNSDNIDSVPGLDSVAPPSPPWMDSMGELLQENPTTGSQENVVPTDSEDTHHHNDLENSPGLPDEGPSYLSEARKNGAKKEPRPAQWADLDDLLDKLLFLAVSGDDPTFTIHFLLTYRRFATPRSVLLAMQKRMRQLDNPCGDPMFACFAQMRICHLLETWIRDYPHDFAVKGTAGALNALIKSIISKTHLLHYGSEFLPFLEQLPGLVDQDSAWALKVAISDSDSDVYTPDDEDDDETHINDAAKSDVGSGSASVDSHKVAFPSRERKASLPLPKALLAPAQLNGSNPHAYDQSPKQHIKDLVKLAQAVLNTDSDEIAQEITRQGVKRFLEIKPRDWLHYTFVSFGSGRKIDSEPITAFNAVSNLLADWVVSLILCHERPRQRAKQIEKFVEIAQKLRQMNNYSALRAFVAGINNATDDPTMEQFKARSPDQAKNLMSWDLLLQQIRSHRSYRLALRNSKGACIPALEVHMSDLIRAHEGNGDTNDAYPSKIHWAKFNMMGRFITSTLQCQAQCRNSNDYDFPERSAIAELFVKIPVMSSEMQKSRLKSEDFDFDDVHPTVPPSQPRDIAGLRRLFFW